MNILFWLWFADVSENIRSAFGFLAFILLIATIICIFCIVAATVDKEPHALIQLFKKLAVTFGCLTFITGAIAITSPAKQTIYIGLGLEGIQQIA